MTRLPCLLRPQLALALFGLAAAGCTTTPPAGGGGAPPTGAPAETAVAPSVVAAATGASAPSPSVPGGPTVVKLRDGATMEVPAGAKPRPAPPNLPDKLLAAHVFRLEGEREGLSITELDREGRPCTTVLDDEWAKMDKARKDKDAERLAYRNVASIEEIRADGRRLLYSESKQGRPTDPERREATLATATMCEGDNYVALVYATDKAQLSGEIRGLLTRIAGSYRPR